MTEALTHVYHQLDHMRESNAPVLELTVDGKEAVLFRTTKRIYLCVTSKKTGVIGLHNWNGYVGTHLTISRNGLVKCWCRTPDCVFVAAVTALIKDGKVDL